MDVSPKNPDHSGRYKVLMLIKVRIGSIAAISVLVLRRLLFLVFPDFLPSRSWFPHSLAAKCIGIAVSSLMEVILLLTLLTLHSIFTLHFRFRGERERMGIPALDFLLFGLAYVLSFFLLSPPGPQ
jgi:hypothetical protein